jgi:SAM-dependent methyltransferase
VLDLGYGFGWHCRYAHEQQAQSVIGVDLSAKMLARAKLLTDDLGITYDQSAIEDIIAKLVEPTPMPEMVLAQPTLKDDNRRPTFLIDRVG